MRTQTNAARSLNERWVPTEELPGEMFDPAAFESAALAIHVVNDQGLIVEANRAFELMFGGSRRLYLGKHTAVLGAEPVAAGLRLLEGIRSGMKPQGAWRGTMRNERFNGTAFETRAHVYPMRVGGHRYLVFFQEEVRAAAKAHVPAATRAREQVFSATS